MLRQADSADLAASLLYLVQQHDLLEQIPAPARAKLEWVRPHAQRHRQAVAFEVGKIGAALRGVGVPLILLKGAAYTQAGLACSHGRLFSDIDILVPKAGLDATEAALMMNGWVSGHHDAYDQRYYRQWMHELPPMHHVKRQSVIDVHHAILPQTAAVWPDPDKLRAAAVAVDGQPDLWVLAPADMVLHSAVHLFYEGEFNHGLRDLLDIHRLLQQFGADPAFWKTLPRRAAELQLSRPLFYALRYAAHLLGTPVPGAVLDAISAGRPNALLLALMDQLFGRALLPPHPSCTDWASAATRFALYIRGNWLRMPPLMLARHLFQKAFIRPKPESKAATH
ncbi:hypothetical protein CR103_12900 [Massilia psychrophila]|uniref:Nucleotidyltransferase n=2 Tax=Massilia psychrophila TaxID=1603353 RepID=A0A2G8T014_9BURK|nr:hypothetical protein CR103_12900 [Massilia psychrophila]